MDKNHAGQQCIKSGLNTLEKTEAAAQNISGNNPQLTHRAYSQHISPTEQPAQQHLLLHIFLPIFKIIYFSFKSR